MLIAMQIECCAKSLLGSTAAPGGPWRPRSCRSCPAHSTWGTPRGPGAAHSRRTGRCCGRGATVGSGMGYKAEARTHAVLFCQLTGSNPHSCPGASPSRRQPTGTRTTRTPVNTPNGAVLGHSIVHGVGPQPLARGGGGLRGVLLADGGVEPEAWREGGCRGDGIDSTKSNELQGVTNFLTAFRRARRNSRASSSVVMAAAEYSSQLPHRSSAGLHAAQSQK